MLASNDFSGTASVVIEYRTCHDPPTAGSWAVSLRESQSYSAQPLIQFRHRRLNEVVTWRWCALWRLDHWGWPCTAGRAPAEPDWPAERLGGMRMQTLVDPELGSECAEDALRKHGVNAASLAAARAGEVHWKFEIGHNSESSGHRRDRGVTGPAVRSEVARADHGAPRPVRHRAAPSTNRVNG